MSQYASQLNISRTAEETFAEKQYYICMVGTSAGYIKLADAAAAEGTHCLGIVQNDPAAESAANVAIAGTSKVVCVANISIGEKVMSDGNGKATPVDGDQKSVAGIALEPNTAGDGGIIEILLTPGGVGQADESN